MERNIFELKVDLLRNVPFLLDAILEVGLGLFMLTRERLDMWLLTFGWAFVLIGIIQFIRKLKTFHLTDTELIIKRPLIPFSLGQERFKISKVKGIKFVRVFGKGAGPHLNIITADQAESFRIETSKEKIDEFEIKLKSLGIVTIRDGM